MTFDNGYRAVEHLLIHRVGSQHLGKSLRLFAELLLQKPAGVNQVIAAGNQKIGIKRLRDIIIRANLQTFDIVLYSSTCG